MTVLLLIRLLLKRQSLSSILTKYKYLFLVLIAMLFFFSATPQVTANFTTITSTEGCGSLLVEFQDLSVGNPTTWLWDFGNGNTSSLQNPLAVYNIAGNYNVTLTVADSLTDDTKTIVSLIQVYEIPDITLVPPSVSTGCMPLNTDFLYQDNSNEPIVSWQWDFGDGGASNVQYPNYTYNSAGDFSVSLLVSNVYGCEALITKPDIIKVNIKPNANFAPDITYSCDSSEIVSFLNNSINASSYTWDFGDGTVSNSISPSHSFSVGIHSVTLYAQEGNCKDTLVMTDIIEVIGAAPSDFISNTDSGCEGLSVNFFDATNGNPNTFLWDFGDGITSVLQNPTHIYDTAGFYDVTLTTSISGECIQSVIFPSAITVFAKPVISFICDTIGCSTPFNVDFINNSIHVDDWVWDFGDGNTSNIENPSNTYVNQGIFDVSLFASNNSGCTSSLTIPSYIKINEIPNLNIDAAPLISCTGEDVLFSNANPIPSGDFFWDFGDGSYANTQMASHQYLQAGLYDVTLIAGVNTCKDTLKMIDYIRVLEPSANFNENYNCDDPLKVSFESISVGADSIFWDFGDGTTSTLNNPSHSFSNLGVHTVTLSATNNLTGCTHILKKEIKLTKPVAQFDYLVNANNSYEDSIGCVPKTVYINNYSQDYSYFKLLYSDGYIGDSPVRTFTNAGVYDVTMVITDLHGCKDTSTRISMYNMYDVDADFDVSSMSGCDSLLVEFKDHSTPSSSVIWEFGDGGSSTINNPQHFYQESGVYDVTLYVESTQGCKDTLNKIEYVNFQKPSANFNSNFQNICEGDVVQFTNLSEGTNIISSWDFGDGILSSLYNPEHKFLTNGAYDINLLIIDSAGCSDSLNLSGHIQVLSPKAEFSSLALNSDCPPLIADFTNLSSSDANYFEWDFGDGSISFVEDPSHLFSSSGVFDVSLIVSNSFGCRDTIFKNNLIDMSGLIPTAEFSVSDLLICKGDSVDFSPIASNVDYFLWDFGNGEVSTDSLATAIYNNAGIFIPNLIVENSSGCQVTIHLGDTIKVNEVVIDAGVNLEVCKGESIELNSTGNASIFNWSPANTLSSVNISNPKATPQSNTFYYVNHSDGLCSAFDSVFVYVHNEVPNPTFLATNLCDGDVTSFIANSGLSTINNSYVWSFGQSGQVVNSVLNAGSNDISLIVENLNNLCRDTIKEIIEIFPKPIANFISTEVCLGEKTIFYDNSSNNVSEWAYNFGDGIGVSANPDTEYTYYSPGIFNVNLNVTSDMGCESNIVQEVIVHHIPLVDFMIESHCEGKGNIFTNTSSVSNSNITNIKYDFNNNLIPADSICTHIFNGSGFFDVTLEVNSSEGCSAKQTKVAEVFTNPNVDFFTSSLCKGEEIIFNNLSSIFNSDISSYNWTFSTGETSNEKDVVHTFWSDGLFEVSLSVTSDKGCEGNLNKEIIIPKLPSVDFVTLSDACLGDEIQIRYNPSVNDSKIISWKYNFGDGKLSNDKNPKHIYSYIGNFDIGLEVVSDLGCTNDTLIPSIITIHPAPYADFQPEKLLVSENYSEINFYNYSEGATSFTWDFDNGEYSFDDNPVYTFNDIRKYNVSLTAINDIGCSSEIIKTIQVNPEYNLFIPNTFTPDGDGINDVFIAKGKRLASIEMQIFDRWGGIVFESSDINLGWNGNNFSGEQLDSGIYLYHIAVYDLNGRLWVYNGELKLMR